ncbi:MAG: phage tail protein [Janthinobacterium lividum]
MSKLATLDRSTTAIATTASRRTWLKGFGALLGTGLLAAPTELLASPAAAAGSAPAPSSAEAASALVGGDEFIGMVKLLTGTAVPQGWLRCDGRELAVADYPALFALLGTTYGGNGRTTFALPDMRAGMADMAAAAANRPAEAVPLGQLCAIKVANAPATTTAVAELRMAHLHRSRRTA